MGFSGWDWAVFVAALIASLGTGLAAGWVARRRTVRGDAKGTAAEFLMGGRTLNPLVVALSTMVGAVSAITLLGNAAEMYAFGTQLWMNHFGIVLGFVFVHLVNLKVLYPLRITSVFTYIEGRFQSKALRSFTTVFTFLGTFLYLGLCAYTPSLAMQTLTGLPTWASIVIMGGICTFYSAWGGVRAVVYTDMLQVLVMVVGVVVILVTAVMEVGGLGRVWEVARQHGRVELWNVDPNPLQRHSLWLVTVQGYFLPLVLFGTGQAQVQRVCSVATWNKAVGAHYLNLAVLLTVVSCCNLMGIAIFAVYATCDPLATGAIQKADQIVPFYVMDRLSSLYGVAGLFMASLYAGGLSSVASSSSSFSSLTLPSSWPAGVVIGVAGMVSGLACTWVGGVFQAAQTILGTINAPLLGLFLLGMCCPFANKTGGAVGLGVSLAFNMWVCVGAMLFSPPPTTLPFSDEGCNSSTSFPSSSFPSTFSSFSSTNSPSSSSFVSYSTSLSSVSHSFFPSMESTFSSTFFSSSFSSSFLPSLTTTERPEEPHVFPLYLISYTLYPLIGVSITVLVGAFTSLISKPWTTEQAGRIYLHPTFYALQRRWERRGGPRNPPSASTQTLVPLEKF
ncbi:hypothetical protein O3P69_008523 [Scylla paramamosain]|uniref:Sodium-coupled monocarboxylate transporter 1 n=1 Tax=Scylla paramamosain TaxID=85552 RepID=A0AAW0SL08_SCYPA